MEALAALPRSTNAGPSSSSAVAGGELRRADTPASSMVSSSSTSSRPHVWGMAPSHHAAKSSGAPHRPRQPVSKAARVRQKIVQAHEERWTHLSLANMGLTFFPVPKTHGPVETTMDVREREEREERELLGLLEHLESLDLSNNDLCHSAFPSVKRRSNSFSSPLNAISDPFSMWWDDDDDTTASSHNHYHSHHHRHSSADTTAAATAAFLASLSLTEPLPMPTVVARPSPYSNMSGEDAFAMRSSHTLFPSIESTSSTKGSIGTSPVAIPPVPPPSPIDSYSSTSSSSSTSTPTPSQQHSHHHDHLPPMLPSLTRLTMRNNNLDRIPRYVCFITSLESLSIELNGVTSLKGVQILTRLTELNAQMNEIKGKAPQLAALSSLRTLILGMNHLTVGGLPKLHHLTCLSTLKLNDNSLGKESLKLASSTSSLPSPSSTSSSPPSLFRSSPSSPSLPLHSTASSPSSTSLRPAWSTSTESPSSGLESTPVASKPISFSVIQSSPPSSPLSISPSPDSESSAFASSASAFATLIRKLPRDGVLAELVLGGNSLGPSVPENIGQLETLTHLDISRNGISELGEALFTLKRLTTLVLSKNSLTELPESIGLLTSLTYLKADGNMLTSLPEDALRQLTNLHALELQHNQLEVFPLCALHLARHSLRELDLAHNCIDALPTQDELPQDGSALQDLTRLTRLGLQYNFIGTVPECLTSVANLVSFEHMYAAQLVIERLYIGGIDAARNKVLLRKLNITHVLNASMMTSSAFFPTDFHYLILEAMDNMKEDMLRHFERCHEFIDEGRNTGGVLIHCQAGISRSATVLVAYLMRTLRLPLRPALEMARRSRPQLCPNDNFLAQLRTYEAQLALSSPSPPSTAAPLFFPSSSSSLISSSYSFSSSSSSSSSLVSSSTTTLDGPLLMTPSSAFVHSTSDGRRQHDEASDKME